MNVWNDYFTPLIYINDSRKYTLPLGLASMKGMYSTDWPVLIWPLQLFLYFRY